MIQPNKTERFQTVCRLYFNPLVEKHFKEVGDFNPNDSRSVLKDTCLHDDNDSMFLTLGRMLFWENEIKEKEDYYAIPVTNFQQTFTYLPQIALRFEESKKDAFKKGKSRVRAQISFRLLEDTITNLKDSDYYLTILGKKIVSLFAKYSWEKGEIKVNYIDKQRGYKLSLFSSTEAQGIEVIKKVLQVQNHPFESQYLTISQSKKDFDLVEQDKILGDTFEKPNLRLKARVHFKKAEFKYYGRSDIVIAENILAYPDTIKPK